MTSRRRMAMLVILAVTGGRLTACGRPQGSASIYVHGCANCHGPKGVPTDVALRIGAPSFADASWQQKTTDDAIRQRITKGDSRGLMPAFPDLSAADLDGLVTYIRALGTKH